MIAIDIQIRSSNRTVSGARLCASIGLFVLCNFAGAAIIPLIAMASA